MSEISLRLAGDVGAAGLRLATGSPGLLATVDQHAAEVRDALAAGPYFGRAGGPFCSSAGEMRDALAGERGEGRAERHAEPGPATRLLLAYARGFVDAAIGRGWSPRGGAATDWETLRLAAICQLMTDQLAPQA